MQAYCVVGKGADLAGYAHEWGGPVSKLLPLFNYARQQLQQPITVITPSSAKNLRSHFVKEELEEHLGFLGMIKILKSENLFSKIKRHASHLGINLVLNKKEDTYYFGVGDQVFETKDLSDLTKLFFGPYKASNIHQFDEITTQAFEKLFPLPVWIWGWDSV